MLNVVEAPDSGLRDAACVVSARREIDEILAALVAQPFDQALIQRLTRWLIHVYPQAGPAYLRLLTSGRRGPFSEAIPVAGAALGAGKAQRSSPSNRSARPNLAVVTPR